MVSRPTTRKPADKMDASVRILVIYGQDDMLKRTYLQQLRDALHAEHGEVETFQLEGKTAQLSDVFDELRSYSLMQQYKVVIVDNADQFVKTHRKALERYAANPVDHATLVLRSGSWHKGNLDKLIAKVGILQKCDAPTPSQAQQWLVNRTRKEHQRTISRDGAALLVRKLGTELMKLDSEVAKLALLVEADQTIEADLVEQVVGRSSDEQAWAVQEAVLGALANRAGGQAIEKIHELVDLAGQPEVLVVYFVADLVRKLVVAQSMRRCGLPDTHIARELKLWGSRQGQFMAVLRRLDQSSIQRLFDQIVRMDGRSKSGLGKPLGNLECFCVGLADV